MTIQCSVCGVFHEKEVLYDVVTKDGVVKMCEACSRHNDFPIIRKPTIFQLKEAARKPTVYERLSKMAGIKVDVGNDARGFASSVKKDVNEEKSLKDIIDKNYRERVKPAAKLRPDLVDNFHWILMRVRRSRKMSQRQLAEAINEPEAAIKLAEEGFLPEDEDKLLNKLQNYLKINLSKNPEKKKPEMFYESNEKISSQEKITAENFKFDNETTKKITIADIKKIFSEKKEEKKEEKNSEEKENANLDNGNKEISDEEIAKIIFRK